jgi:hypothetical protein
MVTVQGPDRIWLFYFSTLCKLIFTNILEQQVVHNTHLALALFADIDITFDIQEPLLSKLLQEFTPRLVLNA